MKTFLIIASIILFVASVLCWYLLIQNYTDGKLIAALIPTAALATSLSNLFKRKETNTASMSQTSGNNSTNIQVGGNINLEVKNDRRK